MSTLITSYTNPDLDGYSCAVAYAELLRVQGKEAQAHLWGEPQLEAKWIIETFDLPRAAGPIDWDDDIVLVDCSNPEDLPFPLRLDQVVEIIDHHRLNRGSAFINAKLQIEPVGAAATLVAERFKQAGKVPSVEAAFLLLGGILSNTDNLTKMTTQRNQEMAKWLFEVSGAPVALAHQMFTAKSNLDGKTLITQLIADAKLFNIQKKKIIITQLEVIGISTLLSSRRSEIEQVISDLKQEKQADFAFANLRDLEQGVSYILCIDEQTRALFDEAPDIEWTSWLGLSRTLTLRKNITAWMNEKLSG